MSAQITLAEAQSALAREDGFGSWARLKHYVESITDPAMQQFKDLANRLASAYTMADINAIREINWQYGTSFIWYRETVNAPAPDDVVCLGASFFRPGNRGCASAGGSFVWLR
jgi:hypothetical protein